MTYITIAILTSILIPCGLYFILSRNFIKTLIGLSIFGHGINFFILCCGKFTSVKAAFKWDLGNLGNVDSIKHETINIDKLQRIIENLDYKNIEVSNNFLLNHINQISGVNQILSSEYANPLPQALILTSIVIGLAAFCIFIVITLRK
jgi:multisubunit Na+/H+ antiporter MnhC subunit